MSSEKTEIICAYCGSVWDYGAHEICPYCAAAPDMKQIKSARAAAAKRKKQNEEVVTSKNPGVLLSMWVASKLKLWLIILAVLIVIPIVVNIILAIVPSSAKKLNPQVVDNIKITPHSVGEEIKVVDYLTVTVSEPSALLLTESSLSVMIPETHAVLLVKVTAVSDGKSHSLYSIKDDEYTEIYETPYLIINDTAYQPVSLSSFNDLNLPEPELNALIRLEPGYSIKATAGYLCYFVPKDTSVCTINFASKHYQDKLQYLDAIHSVALTVEEVSAE
ncbi:MAG: hypothetical protein ACI4QY_00040 [Oscillospiraceae bacterium]